MHAELRLHPSREGKPTVAHLPHRTSKDREHPYTRGACMTHQKALRHILLWEYISANIKLQARSNMLETQLKLPQTAVHMHRVLMIWTNSPAKSHEARALELSPVPSHFQSLLGCCFSHQPFFAIPPRLSIKSA